MTNTVKGVEIDSVKDKLIELLDEATPEPFCNVPEMECSMCEYNHPKWHCSDIRVADYLIAHDVTVQRWIPVTERLPEIPDGWVENPNPVLYMMKNTKTIYTGYYGECGIWRDKYFRQYADSRNGVDVDDVLCWMYQHDLPEPPTGE